MLWEHPLASTLDLLLPSLDRRARQRKVGLAEKHEHLAESRPAEPAAQLHSGHSSAGVGLERSLLLVVHRNGTSNFAVSVVQSDGSNQHRPQPAHSENSSRAGRSKS
jgi:hypothetical protein